MIVVWNSEKESGVTCKLAYLKHRSKLQRCTRTLMCFTAFRCAGVSVCLYIALISNEMKGQRYCNHRAWATIVWLSAGRVEAECHVHPLVPPNLCVLPSIILYSK